MRERHDSLLRRRFLRISHLLTFFFEKSSHFIHVGNSVIILFVLKISSCCDEYFQSQKSSLERAEFRQCWHISSFQCSQQDRSTFYWKFHICSLHDIRLRMRLRCAHTNAITCWLIILMSTTRSNEIVK